MKRKILQKLLFSASVPLAGAMTLSAAEFNDVPSSWKWISDSEAVFSYDGTYTDSTAFAFNVRRGKVKSGVSAPERFRDFPLKPEGAVNPTYSPDSTMIAFTRDNDLYVADIASGSEKRLTFDGTDLILNGYASWVYYEEILGRSTNYKAFWWSPDSRKIGFYRFDNTRVPLFPIYSPFGQDGSVSNTRYPKAGETNPSVKIGIIDVASLDFSAGDVPAETVWADFGENPDQYFGTPFWNPEGTGFYVSRMPRSQQSLELYRVDAEDGAVKMIYEEESTAWVNWISGAVFTDKGLYMARCLDPSDWEQVYFLSYDGGEFRQVSDGEYWNISLLGADEKRGEVFFTSWNASHVRMSVYASGRKGDRLLTNPAYDVKSVVFSPDMKHFAAAYSNFTTPDKVAVFGISGNRPDGTVVADRAGEDFDAGRYALPELVLMETRDGLILPAAVTYPKDFDPFRKYPVHFDIYGGPDIPLVRDRWSDPSDRNQWWSENGIIEVVADCRAAGHNGRRAMAMIYRCLTVHELQDFIAWSEYFRALPYVDASRIGVEGFSFGGTMTAMLVMRFPEAFPYGIAGGGVYDWALYDTHYTERYMGTPQDNPEGYAVSRAIGYADSYPASVTDTARVRPVYLKITHGTGDDNVHYQNTLQLIDALHKAGKSFDFMVYPDGKHGYRGYQGDHFLWENRSFWLRHLCR